MKRSSDRILTTHVGSIIRPAELLALGAAARAGGAAEQARYEECLTRSVRAVVARQVKAGIDIVNDGEFGKSSWAAYVLGRMSGWEVRPYQRRPLVWLGRDRERFPELMAREMPLTVTGAPTEACVGAIAYTGAKSIARDIANLQGAVAGSGAEEAFVTSVAPASTAYNGVNEFYASDRDYVFAIADALRREYQAIHAAGLIVQIDDAVLANMYDELVRKSPADYRHWAELRVEALNRATEGIPEDRIRYHICFGSWHVPHVCDAPLDEMIDLILSVRAGAYSIEAANPRHEHEWRVWEKAKLPPGRILIPGIVTHHTITVEHPRLVADRIVRFAKLVGRENVIAGTDCGFAQQESIQRIPAEVMWAKIESLAEGARLATKELWGR